MREDVPTSPEALLSHVLWCLFGPKETCPMTWTAMLFTENCTQEGARDQEDEAYHHQEAMCHTACVLSDDSPETLVTDDSL